MFPEKVTRQARQQAMAAFANDIKSRCAQIIDHLRRKGGGDITKNLRILPDVSAATVACYTWNCIFCPHNSLVCSGTGGLGDWWFNSGFLPTHGIHHLQMKATDKELLRAILEIRLGEQAVYSVSSNTSTQKYEAFNRGVLLRLPKEVNYGKNFVGRLASKTLQLNNNIHSAVETNVATITDKTLGKKSSQYLKNIARRVKRRKKVQKTAAYKSRRRQTRAQLEHKYHISRSGCNPTPETEYVKGQLDLLSQ